MTASGYAAAHACHAASANICVESPAPEMRVGRDRVAADGAATGRLASSGRRAPSKVAARVVDRLVDSTGGAAAATGAVGMNDIGIERSGRATTATAARLAIAIAAIAGLTAIVRRIGNSTTWKHTTVAAMVTTMRTAS